LTLFLALALQETPASAPEIDPGAVQRALETVFEQPAFRRELERSGEAAVSPRQILMQYVVDFLRRCLGKLEELHESAPFLYWLVFAALVALLVLLVAHIAWTFRSAFRVDVPGSGAPEAEEERVQRYRELREQANRLATEGAWREAARALLLALLALIEERKVLHLARGWTNREILQRLALPGGEGAQLDSFRRAVEDAWYGGHALDRAQLAELAVCVDRCAQVLRPRAEAPA